MSDLSMSSANSIEWQGDFSGGQSPKNSIMQWNHELSNPDVERGDFTIRSFVESGTAYQIEINMAGSNPVMFQRYLGCIMIGVMPDKGLGEALLSLRDMVEFYGHKLVSQPTRLAPKAIVASITDHKKRPDLVLTE